MPLSLNKTCPYDPKVSEISPEQFAASLLSNPCQAVWLCAKSNSILLGSAEDALSGPWLAFLGMLWLEALLKQRSLNIYPALPRD
jgi:hypothetical protein